MLWISCQVSKLYVCCTCLVADKEGGELACLQARSLQQETLLSTSKPWKSWHGA